MLWTTEKTTIQSTFFSPHAPVALAGQKKSE